MLLVFLWCHNVQAADNRSQWFLTSMQACVFCVLLPGLGERTAFQAPIKGTALLSAM